MGGNLLKHTQLNRDKILDARKMLIITILVLVAYMASEKFLVTSNLMSATDVRVIETLIFLIYSIFCGSLYNAIYNNLSVAFGIGFCTYILIFYFLGAGSIAITLYLLVKTSSILKNSPVSG